MISGSQANIRLNDNEKRLINNMNIGVTEIFKIGLRAAASQFNPEQMRLERISELRNKISLLTAELTALEEDGQKIKDSIEALKENDVLLNQRLSEVTARLQKMYEYVMEDSEWQELLEANYDILIQAGWKGSLTDLEKLIKKEE